MIFADTHVLVWLGQGSHRLPAQARDTLLDEGFAISAVTSWEYADLQGRGRLGEAVLLHDILEAFASSVVDFPAAAADIAASLPQGHGDPVDRMLVGHAMSAGAVLATADRKMRQYPVRLLW
ncbi:MAG: type II toxin-antitoxin system VapC family toxin [Sphingomicrobium sp.]